MKKLLGVLGVLVLLSVLGVTVLFGYSVYKDLNETQEEQNKVSQENNQKDSEEDKNQETVSNTQTNNNQEQAVQEETPSQEENNNVDTSNKVNTDIGTMSDEELMEYYMTYMDENDRAITEGKVEAQRGNEYVDSIREEVNNNPDIIKEWAK
ncbi:hypothetical protein CPT_Machias_021 [Staphylococcus phage Machias]|nr:hypothetical protein CPT_Machias_021 [Staphylococcus phage Machias]